MKSILVLAALLFINSQALWASAETSSIILKAMESHDYQNQEQKVKMVNEDAKIYFSKGTLSMPLAHIVHKILKNQDEMSVTDAVKIIVQTLDEQGLAQQIIEANANTPKEIL